MSIKIGGLHFDGPYFNTASLQNRAGVYAILDCQYSGNYVLDVGESATLKTRVEGHERQECWRRRSSGRLGVAVYYTPRAQQAGRRQAEQAIRSQYRPPCGAW